MRNTNINFKTEIGKAIQAIHQPHKSAVFQSFCKILKYFLLDNDLNYKEIIR